MSMHASFGKGGSLTKFRSVIKRFEKIQILQKKELWSEEKGILGLPKVKMIKIKVKKEKPKEEGAAEGAAAPGATEAPAGDAKAAKPAKPAKKA